MKQAHSKLLSKNDTGETGAHQAGIVVPKKNSDLLKFFPQLKLNEFNPEAWIDCTDPDGEVWKMRYIYYNGKTFTPAKSTRNEYRITHMTKFFKKWNAKAGDSVMFVAKEQKNSYEISICKAVQEHTVKGDAPKTIILRGWSRVF